MHSPRVPGPFSRPPRGRFALYGTAWLLAAASACYLESDALNPHPRMPDVTTSRAERAGAANVETADLAWPSSDPTALRGPRHELLSLSRTEMWAAWNSLRGDAYDLDQVERIIDTGARIE